MLFSPFICVQLFVLLFILSIFGKFLSRRSLSSSGLRGKTAAMIAGNKRFMGSPLVELKKSPPERMEILKLCRH